MRKFAYLALNIASAAVVIMYLSSCFAGGGGAGKDPITPAPDLKEGTVDPRTRAITITKGGVSVTVEHWSKYRLDHKYTTPTTRSPFFYLGTWSQSFQSEAFWVTIKNDTPRGVVVNFKETKLYDERKYEYVPTELDELEYRFRTKGYFDLKAKNGLELARQILLMAVLGPKRLVPAGKTVGGFIAFYTPSKQAATVWLIITLEKEPELATAAYEKLSYRYDFVQNLALRTTQEATVR